jgi:hypothetical protein
VIIRPEGGREKDREMPGDDEIALAQLAGDTIVAAAATSGWEPTRLKLARLLGHGDRAKTKLMAQRLAESREQLAGATDASLESARATLVVQWVTQLTDLLEEDPDIGADLRALVEEIRIALPTGAVSLADDALVVPWNINISADRGALASRAIPKDVVPLGPTSPGLATS